MHTNGNPSEADVIRALSKVNDPELGRDLVTLGMVRDVAVTGRDVALTIVLTTPACPLKGQIQSEATSALREIGGFEGVEISWDAQVPRDSRLSDRLDIGVKNAIAVGSGKGGVGKTTTAVNLAVALAQEGAQVGLLDADVYGPNVPLMMGVTGQRPVSRDGKKIDPIVAHGVRMMSIGFLVPAETPLVWRGPMLHGTLRQFLGDVDWGGLDYLIVDLPPGTGDVQLSLAQSLPLTGAVVVTTPQKVAQADVVKAIAMFQLEQIGVPVLGVVENMSAWTDPDTGLRYDIFGSGGGRDVAREMSVPYLGEVPLDPRLPAASDAGRPLVLDQPDAPASLALRRIARDLSAAISVMVMSRPEIRFQSDPDLALT
jgi:ATP-binding protein involved in chromosome partitioning